MKSNCWFKAADDSNIEAEFVKFVTRLRYLKSNAYDFFLVCSYNINVFK